MQVTRFSEVLAEHRRGNGALTESTDGELGSGSKSTPESRLETLRRQASRAKEVDIVRYETEESEVLLRDLVPVVKSLLEETIGTLDLLVGEPLDQPIGDSASNDSDLTIATTDLRLDGLVSDGHAADIAYVGRTELRRCRSCLEGIDPSWDRWRLIDVCGSGLRKVAKVALAILRVVAEQTGSQEELVFESECQISLQIRTAYSKFRRSLHRDLGFCHDESIRLRRQIQSSATATATLVGRDVYPHCRISDRVVLRQLQDRVIRWLRQEGDPDLEQGARLWQDLRGFGDLLKEVNHRQELVEHDRAVFDQIAEARASLADPEQLRNLAKRLYGLNDELDELLTGPLRPKDLVRSLNQLSAGTGPHW